MTESLEAIRKFEGNVTQNFDLDPELVTNAGINVHPYKFLEGLRGKHVKVLVLVEGVCSCGAKTFNKDRECDKCREDQLDFEANCS